MIPIEEPPGINMKENAEQQAEDLKRKMGDPYGGKSELLVDLTAIGNDEWHFPLPGAKVISHYGSRGGRRHSGVDLKTRPNDSIYAVFDGIVTMSEVFAGYGNCIKIYHENGLVTLYSHNSRNLVKAGEYVKSGQAIALTGRTGRATTEHLHFEVRVNDRHYDPQLLFDYATKKLKRHKLIFKKGGGVVKK